MAITIDDNDLHYIYSVFGYPTVTLDDIGLFTEDSVKEYVIKQALYEYFRYFPIKQIQSYRVSNGNTEGSVDFPDLDTYGVLDCRFTLSLDSDVYSNLDTSATNPFFSFRNVTKKNGGRRLGSRYSYGFDAIQSTVDWTIDSLSAQKQVFRNYVDHQARTLTYFSQQSGYVVITWAKMSDDVSDVIFRYKRDFLNLCKAELKLYWSEFLTKIDSEFPSSFDADTLKEEGQELKDKIMEKWNNKMKPVIMRG